MSSLLQWSQPLITVISLTFGVGILYGDVQDVKRAVERGEHLSSNVRVMEVKLESAEISQRETVAALEKVAEAVNKLNTTVTKLETRLER